MLGSSGIQRKTDGTEMIGKLRLFRVSRRTCSIIVGLGCQDNCQLARCRAMWDLAVCCRFAGLATDVNKTLIQPKTGSAYQVH
jgi:hypothetical protein